MSVDRESATDSSTRLTTEKVKSRWALAVLVASFLLQIAAAATIVYLSVDVFYFENRGEADRFETLRRMAAAMCFSACLSVVAALAGHMATWVLSTDWCRTHGSSKEILAPENRERWRRFVILAQGVPLVALVGILTAVYHFALTDTYHGRGTSFAEALDDIFTGLLRVPFLVLVGGLALGLIGCSLRFAMTGSRKAAVRGLWFLVVSVLMSGFALFLSLNLCRAREKPVIYLYPETERVVSVRLDFPGRLECTYPEHGDNGWRVLAKPDGSLVDLNTGRTHYCLYWEGRDRLAVDLACGFVVPGEQTAEFLESTLDLLGLNEREVNEFIVYWLPRMQKNRCNLVHFETDEYVKNVPLRVDPVPDTTIRFFMFFKKCPVGTVISPQTLERPERHGFVLVEWGGAEL